MRLLLIEDDRKAARLLAKGLQEEGFVVDVAPTGEDGEEKAAVNEYDLIVLDWLLPGKDGLAVCRALRERRSSIPILMLTARDSVADRVSGLSTGADDYLTKPFAFAELLARIRALLRRSRVAQPAVLRVADLTLDPATRRDRKSTRLNSSHLVISYAVFCLKKKTRRPSRSRARIPLAGRGVSANRWTGRWLGPPGRLGPKRAPAALTRRGSQRRVQRPHTVP